MTSHSRDYYEQQARQLLDIIRSLEALAEDADNRLLEMSDILADDISEWETDYATLDEMQERVYEIGDSVSKLVSMDVRLDDLMAIYDGESE
jgi:uncharacterized protein YoxC